MAQHCVKTREDKLVACFGDAKAAKTFIMLDGRAGLQISTSTKGRRAGVGKLGAARRRKRGAR
jgi:hypothetical protein